MTDWLFWLCYLSPSLIAWYRSRQGHTVVPSLSKIVWFNVLLGWTVVAWLVSMAGAFGKNPIAWIAFQIVKGRSMPGHHSAQSYDAGAPPQAQSQGSTCGQCQGAGSMSCSSCGGRGNWYDPPQGENGVAQLRNCSACISSGRMRCSYCGGSGRLP